MSNRSAPVPEKANIVAEITGLGWRYIHGIVHQLQTEVAVHSLKEAAGVAGAVTVAVPGIGKALRLHLRADRVILTLEAPGRSLTECEVALAAPLSAAVREFGLHTEAETGENSSRRSAQLLEIAIDAMDIGAIRPFWKALLDCDDEPGEDTRTGPLVDPLGQWPTLWFQLMDEPRTQRNRIHLDVSVPHDEAEDRIAVALAAGGRIVNEEEAPAFWVLADDEGSEACVTTWQEAGESHTSTAKLNKSGVSSS